MSVTSRSWASRLSIPGLRRERGGYRPLPLLARIRIRLLPQRQPYRHPWQPERLPQRVDQIALVAVRHRVGAGAEQHEAWRAGLRLGDVVELEPAARYGRRRMSGEHLIEPAVEGV